MKASILIVGDDPVLLHTRAELLRDWQIVTANSREAEEAILARTYDLLIFSQTAQEKVVRGLIDQARQSASGDPGYWRFAQEKSGKRDYRLTRWS